jgi:hypothetical protein
MDPLTAFRRSRQVWPLQNEESPIHSIQWGI